MDTALPRATLHLPVNRPCSRTSPERFDIIVVYIFTFTTVEEHVFDSINCCKKNCPQNGSECGPKGVKRYARLSPSLTGLVPVTHDAEVLHHKTCVGKYAHLNHHEAHETGQDNRHGQVRERNHGSPLHLSLVRWTSTQWSAERCYDRVLFVVCVAIFPLLRSKSSVFLRLVNDLRPVLGGWGVRSVWSQRQRTAFVRCCSRKPEVDANRLVCVVMCASHCEYPNHLRQS